MKRHLIAAFLTTSVIALAGSGEIATLHKAAYDDNLQAAKAALTAGANVNAPNEYGVTSLELACTNASPRMVELLLKSGANPKTTAVGGETALMTCARTGSVEAVKALIAAGADVNATESKRSQDALMWAAAEGHAGVVEALIAAGASVQKRLYSGYTPLLLAVREGQTDVVRVLLKNGGDANDSIRPVEASGPRPASGAGAPRTGNTALHLATVNGHFDLGSFLLEAGANPNTVEVGYAPLHIVSWVRKPGGGDNDPSPRGSGAMTSLQFVQKLVKHGADINIRMTRKMNIGLTGLNTTGATPFVLAARTGDSELMKTLADLGADPKLPTADGATPLMVAAGLGTRSPGEDAGAEEEVLEAVQLALALGNDINAVDKNGETAMHGAAYKNVPKVVEFLAANGAKISVWNQKNKHGWTPLTIAKGYRFGNYKPSAVTVAAITKVLLAAGVSPDAEPTPVISGNSEYKKP